MGDRNERGVRGELLESHSIRKAWACRVDVGAKRDAEGGGWRVGAFWERLRHGMTAETTLSGRRSGPGVIYCFVSIVGLSWRGITDTVFASWTDCGGESPVSTGDWRLLQAKHGVEVKASQLNGSM